MVTSETWLYRDTEISSLLSVRLLDCRLIIARTPFGSFREVYCIAYWQAKCYQLRLSDTSNIRSIRELQAIYVSTRSSSLNWTLISPHERRYAAFYSSHSVISDQSRQMSSPFPIRAISLHIQPLDDFVRHICPENWSGWYQKSRISDVLFQGSFRCLPVSEHQNEASAGFPHRFSSTHCTGFKSTKTLKPTAPTCRSIIVRGCGVPMTWVQLDEEGILFSSHRGRHPLMSACQRPEFTLSYLKNIWLAAFCKTKTGRFCYQEALRFLLAKTTHERHLRQQNHPCECSQKQLPAQFETLAHGFKSYIFAKPQDLSIFSGKEEPTCLELMFANTFQSAEDANSHKQILKVKSMLFQQVQAHFISDCLE